MIASPPVATLPELRAAPRVDVRFGLVIAALFAALLLPRILLHVMWRDEWHTWLLITAPRTDLATLYTRVSYEGHPFLWYLLNWIGSELWLNPVVMKLWHVILATATAYLIAACAPTSRLGRVLLCAGYFFAFEYAVVSKNYALGVLGLIAFAAVMRHRPRSLVLAALCLALATQSSAFACLVVMAICVWIGVRWLIEGRPDPARFAVAVAIICLAFGATFLQLRGPPDRHYSSPEFGSDVMRGGKMAAAVWRSFVPLPSPTRDWWATNVLDFSPRSNPLNAIQAVLGIATLAGAFFLLPARRGVRWLWLGGAATIIAFGYIVLVGSLRHHGHFFLLFIVAWWIGRSDSPTAGSAPVESNGRRRAMMTLFTIQATAGVIASVADLLMPFSASAAAGRYLRENYPSAAVIGQIDFSTAPLAGEIGRNIYFPTPGIWGSFCRWDRRRTSFASTARLTQIAEILAGQNPTRPVVLALSDSALSGPDMTKFRQIARFADATIRDERYTLYEWIGPVPSPASDN